MIVGHVVTATDLLLLLVEQNINTMQRLHEKRGGAETRKNPNDIIMEFLLMAHLGGPQEICYMLFRSPYLNLIGNNYKPHALPLSVSVILGVDPISKKNSAAHGAIY
jgi:hypothetical protein